MPGVEILSIVTIGEYSLRSWMDGYVGNRKLGIGLANSLNTKVSSTLLIHNFSSCGQQALMICQRSTGAGMVSNSISRDNPLLTGIRGVAAVWVALFHFFPYLSVVFNLPSRGCVPFVRDGFLGVDLFFLLSGFVLMMSYGPRLRTGSPTAIGQFMIARAFRILPMHWAILLLLAAVVALVPGFVRTPFNFTPRAFVESAALVQGLLPQATLAWNRPTWSVSDEWVAYLLFPLLAPIICSVASWRRCLLISASALFCLWGAMRWGLHLSTLSVVPIGGLIRCACEFTAGAFACRAWQLNGSLLRRVADLLTFAGLLVVAGAIRYSSRLDLVAPFGLLALVLGSGCRGTAAELMFGNGIAVFLGAISYSLYLIHIGLFDFLYVPAPMDFVLALPLPARMAVCILVWSLLLALSWLGYRYVEIPFRVYGRGVSRRALPALPHPTPTR